MQHHLSAELLIRGVTLSVMGAAEEQGNESPSGSMGKVLPSIFNAVVSWFFCLTSHFVRRKIKPCSFMINAD
jgi:hypothetical protein